MIELFSPAKINLFFRVLKKRQDHFHEIASLYQTIDLGDNLQLALSHEDRLFCDLPTLPLDSSNLILKAAALFRKKTGLPIFMHCQLTKRIPMQAGLGGGSSNAATTLWGLNELSGRPATAKELMIWGAELGSDVAFFLSKGRAYCTGRGEIIKELPFVEGSCWIAKPLHLALTTASVYTNCKPDLFPLRDPLEALASFATQQPSYFNDLEISSFELCRDLSPFKQQLLSLGFHYVTMTGSGTAFFCIGDIINPESEKVQFFDTQFIRRRDNSWYRAC